MDSVERRIEICKMKNGNTLNLSNLGLDNIPSNIKELEGLEVLDLSDNNISVIENIPSYLNTLILVFNFLTSI